MDPAQARYGSHQPAQRHHWLQYFVKYAPHRSYEIGINEVLKEISHRKPDRRTGQKARDKFTQPTRYNGPQLHTKWHLIEWKITSSYDSIDMLLGCCP